MTEKLKPCPFCGGSAFVNNGPTNLWYVQCQECRIDGKIKSTKSEAVEAWNSRSQPAQAGAEPVAWLYKTPMPDGTVFVGASAERLTIGVGVPPGSTEEPLCICPPAQPAWGPVAWIEGLPEGTTHISKFSLRMASGGRLQAEISAFRYEADTLLVYQTDNDNEYPGWRRAKDVFYHLNFPIVPLIHPPARVPLTDDQILKEILPMGVAEYTTLCGPTEILKFARAVEAKNGTGGGK